MPSFAQRKAVSRLHEAQVAFARDDFAAAELAAAAAVRLDPTVRAGWQLWAETLERQAKLIEAARMLGEALEHHDHPSLLLARVHALIETGQFAEAERRIESLRNRWPTSREPLAYLARTLRDLREFGRLATLLDEALAGPWPDDAELLGLVRTCRAWQGQGPELRPSKTSMRERLLAEYGSVLLGTGHDDGITIPWYSTYLCSNYDVVATCARLRGYAAQFGWRWAEVAAIDEAARPLAILLAATLGAELVELPPAPDPDAAEPSYPDPARCLAVASFLAPGWSTRDHGAWARRCADAGGLFAFGVLDFASHPDPLPPLIGLAGGERICLPWWRLGEARIGFGRFGLIDELPPEIDARPPATIATDYRAPLEQFEFGPNFAAQLRDLLDHRGQLHAGLRARGEFTRIVPHGAPRVGPQRPLAAALEHGDVAEFLRAVGALEAGPHTIGEPELVQLERRFRVAPEVRSRLSDLLYRVAPDRFSTLLHGLVARPEGEVPIRERDGLLHLYGCNPWTGSEPKRATEQLVRWLALGSATNRSEIVQSKYGLHHLAESDAFASILAQLLADEPAIVLGTLRWLHDNPQHHGHAAQVFGLLDHAHADVVFEALQCLRVAKLAVPLARLDRLIHAEPPAHPRLISAAVEQLELSPIAEARPILVPLLDHEDGAIAWAAARSLLRGGELDDRVRGADVIAVKIVERELDGLEIRQLLRALASAHEHDREDHEHDFALFEPLLRASESPSLMKIVAAALSPALLELDDPRLLEYLRRFHDAFGLDPVRGYANYLRGHGDPELDRDAVYGAQGATDVRAGYEAKAVLARWGDDQARAELERALDYASPYREAALEVWFTLLWASDWDRLDAARESSDPDAHDVVWAIVTAPRLRSRTAAWSEHIRADPRREAAWVEFIEARLRAEIPSKFVVGAQSASFAALAELLPDRFTQLCERALAGVPDRLSVDLLEWLARHQPEQARAAAERLLDSPHWGVRQCARRVYARGSV